METKLVLAIREQLPGCQVDVIPAGGVHLWLRLPDRYSDA
jgi:DNA-binding transcriptional MocR family regulator